MIAQEGSLGENKNLVDDSNAQTQNTCKIFRCKLDDQQCLSLENILLLYNQPINEEEAWALCYQITKRMSELPDNELFPIKKFKQILLHKDGNILLNLSSGKVLLYS